MKKNNITFIVLLLCIVTPTVPAVPCTSAVRLMMDCFPYLKHKGGNAAPPIKCCDNVRALNGMANTAESRRDVCNCLKDRAKNARSLNAGRVSGLPAACKVRLTFTERISTSMNCNNVK